MADNMKLHELLSENEERLVDIMEETLQQIKNVESQMDEEGQGEVEEMPLESDLSKLEMLLNRLNN